MFIFEFLSIFFFVIFSFGLASLLFFLSIQISPKLIDFEKLSAYECGFTPVGEAHQSFHIRFYVIGILFLLFDLEIVLLFPWVVTLNFYIHTIFSLSICLLFLFLLLFGFIYEWFKGAFDWE